MIERYIIYHENTQFFSSTVNKFFGRIFFLFACWARGTTKFCMLVFPARSSATALYNSLSSPFLSEGIINGGGWVLNRNPEPDF